MIDPLGQPIYTDPVTGAQYSAEPGGEPFDLVMIASTTYTDLSVTFPKDSAFLWTGLAGVSTGDFKFSLKLPDGTLFSSAAIRKANIVGTAAEPFPIYPAVKVPAGGVIGIPSITELSTAGNTVQLLFLGVRLYPLR